LITNLHEKNWENQQNIFPNQNILCSPTLKKVFGGVRVVRSLVLYVCFVGRRLYFLLFLYAIMLSVHFRYIWILITPFVSSNKKL
jgi:hypothetical protein